MNDNKIIGVVSVLFVLSVFLTMWLLREAFNDIEQENKQERAAIVKKKAACTERCDEYTEQAPRATCEQTCTADANVALSRVSIWD